MTEDQSVSSNEEVVIRVQETPNPMAYKFITNMTLLNEGKKTFLSTEGESSIELVKGLFSVLGVMQIYIFQNTISITHDGSLQSEVFVENVQSILREKIPTHNPDMSSMLPTETKKIHRRSDDPDILQIEEILDRTIRPGLQSDGGDVEVIRFEDNILEILYQGACGGCPSAMYGTLDAIQNILRFEMKNDDLRVTPI